MLLIGAEPHDPLDAGAVVPAPVEQDHLARGGQVRHVALEVPLGLLALGGRGQGDDPADARAQVLGDALDHAALAGRVPSLEDDHDLEPFVLDPLQHLHKLDLEPEQLRLVALVPDLLRPRRRFGAAVSRRRPGFRGGRSLPCRCGRRRLGLALGCPGFLRLAHCPPPRTRMRGPVRPSQVESAIRIARSFSNPSRSLSVWTGVRV